MSNKPIQVFLLIPAHPRYGMTTCLPRTKDRTNRPLPPHKKQNIFAADEIFINTQFYKLKLQHSTCEQVKMIKIDKTGHDYPLFMKIKDKLLTVFASFHTMKPYMAT